jgi:hypothetical protein
MYNGSSPVLQTEMSSRDLYAMGTTICYVRIRLFIMMRTQRAFANIAGSNVLSIT